MAGFVQIIEFQTSRYDEAEALGRAVQSRLDDGRPSSPRRTTITADRDRPGYYLNIVEFDSREAAMDNSARAEVGEFAAQLAQLCDSPLRFYNLDVGESLATVGLCLTRGRCRRRAPVPATGATAARRRGAGGPPNLVQGRVGAGQQAQPSQHANGHQVGGSESQIEPSLLASSSA